MPRRLPALLLFLFLLPGGKAGCWGFYGHRQVNYYAIFLLPPALIALYKEHRAYLTEHAVDPDKRRYAVAAEGPRHYIDLDRYGPPPWDSIPRHWAAAVVKYGADSLQAHGIVPWWIVTVQQRLTQAFRNRDVPRILRLSAELGHYVADAHVPLHASSNHNGQRTGQQGIHGFWESRVPELLAEKEWSFVIGHAAYIPDPSAFIWRRVLESGRAADTVLLLERQLTARFPAGRKYAFELRNGQLLRQYSAAFTRAYDRLLNGMVERRMRAAIYAVASLWYTAWVDAGQPSFALQATAGAAHQSEDERGMDSAWRAGKIIGREE